MLKQSKYNIKIKEFENGDILMFNSFTCSLGVLEFSMIDIFNSIENISSELSKDTMDKIAVMLDNGFLVEHNRDEFNELEYESNVVRFSNDVGKHLTIAPTMQCNMRCPYCYEEKKDKKMSDETIQNLVEFVNKFTEKCENQYFSIVWYGGEPLLELSSILKLSKEFLKICDDKNLKYNASMVTNGILLTGDVAKELKEQCKVEGVQITLDGLEETHNKRRLLIGKGNSFQVICKNIEEARKYMKVSIRVNIDNDNKDEIFKLVDYIVDEKQWIPERNVSIYFAAVDNDTDFCSFDMNKAIDNEVLHSIYLYTQKKYAQQGVSYIMNMYPERLISPCPAVSKNSFVVAPDGDLYKCWHTVNDARYCVGNVNEGIAENNVFYKWLGYNVSSHCKECDKYPVCFGGCPHAGIKSGTYKCTYTNEYLNDIILECYKTIV